jgi:hypothetical protein
LLESFYDNAQLVDDSSIQHKPGMVDRSSELDRATAHPPQVFVVISAIELAFPQQDPQITAIAVRMALTCIK